MKVRKPVPTSYKGIAAASAGAAVLGVTAWLIFRKKDDEVEPNVSEEAAEPMATKKPKSRWRKSLPLLKSKEAIIPIADPANVAKQLFEKAAKRNIEGVMTLLSQIQNTEDYEVVNAAYKIETDKRTMVKQTIVTSLLDKYFTNNPDAKDRIKSALLRIGLKTTPQGKWSLSGFEKRKDLITNVPTFVTDWMGNRIAVKPETILGEAQATTNGMTRFQGLDGKTYKVPDSDVRYL